MKIKINNCYQKKIFNLCLPLYRSILFQRIKFETENTTEENELIKALNIKIPSKLYEQLKAEAEKKNVSLASIVRLICSEYFDKK